MSIIALILTSSVNANFNYVKEFKELGPGPVKELIQYGKEVFDKSPLYIGPKGSAQQVTGNFLTCKNCHLDSGLREFGLQVYDSHGLYPRYRARESSILTLADRINSCIRMPMVGKNLPVKSREMQGLLMYIKFIGKGRKIRFKDSDDRLPPISYPKIAASPKRGKDLFNKHCVRCHGKDGKGVFETEKGLYKYPPLMGMDSYRVGSSMHRTLIFARFIKGNMPYDMAKKGKPVLKDIEALDISAFVNNEIINKRPSAPKKLFKFIEFKPIDYPNGPFYDPFPPDQHRFGPYQPIADFYRNKRKKQEDISDGDLIAP